MWTVRFSRRHPFLFSLLTSHGLPHSLQDRSARWCTVSSDIGRISSLSLFRSPVSFSCRRCDVAYPYPTPRPLDFFPSLLSFLFFLFSGEIRRPPVGRLCSGHLLLPPKNYFSPPFISLTGLGLNCASSLLLIPPCVSCTSLLMMKCTPPCCRNLDFFSADCFSLSMRVPPALAEPGVCSPA